MLRFKFLDESICDGSRVLSLDPLVVFGAEHFCSFYEHSFEIHDLTVQRL